APLLIDSEGHRLSKRQKSITIRELRENQWSPNRILGELAIVGGLVEAHTLSRREISLSELIEIDLNVPSLSQKTIEIQIKE
ncbi:MAG: tRNA glutamyl-Q(34) synthetase GluQRS, partial [Veillonella sp.]|nr:tRNA glutamyl-Q(34) synthetase GluQRS [Veillonella sp.]